jgi:hypothetical protein
MMRRLHLKGCVFNATAAWGPAVTGMRRRRELDKINLLGGIILLLAMVGWIKWTLRAVILQD